jgi:hypothetical protein
MITGDLMGKIGNLMFQIAAIEDMGRRAGLETAYPNIDSNIEDLKRIQSCSSYFNGREYFSIFKNFNWHKNQDKDTHCDKFVNVPFGYQSITPQDYTRYRGYFQSELFFQDRNFILNLFEPSDALTTQLAKYNDIIGTNKAAIHVRRGDYIKLNKIFNVLGMDYYNTAIDCLRPLGVKEFLVFSNDMPWCKENFKGEQFTFIEDDDKVELFLMSKCTHQIIANSSFGWWGAWLNKNPYKKVVAPSKWFVTAQHNAKDIVPLSWIKI